MNVTTTTCASFVPLASAILNAYLPVLKLIE